MHWSALTLHIRGRVIMARFRMAHGQPWAMLADRLRSLPNQMGYWLQYLGCPAGRAYAEMIEIGVPACMASG